MRTGLFLAISALAGVSLAGPLTAAALARKPVSLPAQELELALQSFVKERHLQIIYRSTIVKGRTSPAIEGNLNTEEVLQRLLNGTGLTYRFLDDNTVTITRESTGAAGDSSVDGRHAKAVAFSDSQAGDAVGSVPGSSTRSGRIRLSQADNVSASARAETETSPPLEEVLVTAQKRVQSLHDVPLSVTALDARALERAGIDTVQSLVYSVPSLVVQETGGGFQRYFIRGIGNGNSTSSLVGVYLDEADVTMNSNTQLDIRAIDLDRVEVLKGPQGTLYGAGSAGGTIRFITRDPNLEKWGFSGGLRAFSTEGGDPSGEISGVLNVPLVQDQLGLRIVGTFEDAGGWIDQPARGRNDINDQRLRDVRVKGLWKPTDAATVKALVLIRRNEGDGSNSSDDPNHNLELPVYRFSPTPFTSDFNVYNLTAGYQFSGLSALSSSTYTDSKTVSVIGLRYIGAPPPAPLQEFLNKPDHRASHAFSQELRLSSADEGPLHWVAGAFYKDQKLDYTTSYEYGEEGVAYGDGISTANESSRSTSVFADASYEVTPRTEVGVGVRYFSDDRTLFDGTDSRSGSFHSTDPRVYASFALTPAVRLYANAAEGFRSGGFNDTTSNPETAFQPEKIRSYEAGAKLSLPERRLNAELGLFLSHYEDIQVFRITPDGIGTLNNAGDARVTGFDLSIDYQLTDHLSISLNGSKTDTKYTSLLPGVITVLKGDPLDFSTDYTGRISATYAANVAGLPAFARVDFARIGPSHSTDRSGGYPILYQTDVIDMLNARVGFDRGPWSFELFGTNLTNDNGVQDATGAFGFGSRPRPRTVGIEIRTALD